MLFSTLTLAHAIKNRLIQKEIKFMSNTLLPFTFRQSSTPSSQPSHHSRQQQKEQSQNNRSQKPLQHRPKFLVPVQFCSKSRPEHPQIVQIGDKCGDQCVRNCPGDREEEEQQISNDSVCFATGFRDGEVFPENVGGTRGEKY